MLSILYLIGISIVVLGIMNITGKVLKFQKPKYPVSDELLKKWSKPYGIMEVVIGVGFTIFYHFYVMNRNEPLSMVGFAAVILGCIGVLWTNKKHLGRLR